MQATFVEAIIGGAAGVSLAALIVILLFKCGVGDYD